MNSQELFELKRVIKEAILEAREERLRAELQAQAEARERKAFTELRLLLEGLDKQGDYGCSTELSYAWDRATKVMNAYLGGDEAYRAYREKEGK